MHNNLNKLAQQRITWAERHDPLTGLLRRTPFLESLDGHVKSLREGEDGGVLCMCDIDGLKAVNTLHGRRAGDETLLWLAGLMEDRLRDDSGLARLTGDKFVFLLHSSDVEAALDLVDAMRQRLGQEAFVGEGGDEFHVSASFVVAPMPPTVDNATRWLDLADLCLADGQREARPIVLLRPEAVTSALLETRKMQRVDAQALRRKNKAPP